MSEPLPATPDLAAIEEECRRLWDDAGIHRFDVDGDREIFSVDTPPPYTSAAHLHVGHAMSYAQPDFLVRYQRMRGRRVFYPMGFDDNGLPTERFVERKYEIRKDETTRTAFRELCLRETEIVAETYEELWRALGLSVDWSYRYSTIDDHCRRTAQRSFLDLYRAGRIYRSADPVFWDRELQTALAQADLETIERHTWLYDVVFRSAAGEPLVISTTRPELLPACVALYHHPQDDRYRQLAGAEAVVPIAGHSVPVLTDPEVDPDFGTGLMMVCTFGDADDVRRWKRDRLATRTRLDERGRMTPPAGPYEGMSAEQARASIVQDLVSAGALAERRRIVQRVAVSERSGAAVEFVMRPQWFVRVLDLKDALVARSRELQWHPEWMAKRLDDWIRGLSYDWNISRQRFYGVPFPVWFCSGCDEPVLAEERTLPVDPLEEEAPVGLCPACGSPDLRGDPDVMDTWMTSSMTPQILTNWAGTPGRAALPEWPLTVRAQAHDIIRTWLFYTLLKAHVHNGSAPWTDVVVSGWGLDEQGRRISKRSLEAGRYEPLTLVRTHGADAVRHWAARSRLGQDTRYRERDIRAGRKVVLKLWNVARFCEANGGREGETTEPEDRWIRGRLRATVRATTDAFDVYDYAGARDALDGFLWTFTDDWLEIAKDRFWNAERYGHPARVSAAVTLHQSLRALLGLYAPFLPFVSEHLYQRLYRADEGTVSLHVTPWPSAGAADRADDATEMDAVLAVLRTVRSLRTEQRLPQTAELDVVVVDAGSDGHLVTRLAALESTLRAAARARHVEFGPADVATGYGDLRVAIGARREQRGQRAVL